MVTGFNLFFALFNNLAIFIALVAVYGYLVMRQDHAHPAWQRVALGLSFGVFAVGCMHAKIPVFEGVLVDQRNAIITLGGAFGGPVAAVLSALMAGLYRVYLGGDGVLAGVVGVSLAAVAGTAIHCSQGPFDSLGKATRNSILATLFILPGFLLVDDIQTGFALMKAMALPYGGAIFVGISLGGLLLRRETDRHAAELAFRAGERKYRSLVEGSQDLITATDKDGVFTFVNHMGATILGLPPEACRGMSAFQFIHPDDRQRTNDWFRTQVAHRVAQSRIENRQVNVTTGRSRTVLWSATFEYDNDGNLLAVGSIARDISEVREAEENFRNLFEKMPDGYVLYQIIFDLDGNPVDYRHLITNPAFERITGLQAKDLVGRTVQEVYAESEEHWLAAYRETAATGTPQTVENHSGLLDMYLEMTLYRPAPDKLAVIFENTTPRKKAEQERAAIEAQLRQTQRMEAIGTLSGGIAHDFNNLLSAILGYAELARSDLPESSPAGHDLAEVLNAARRAKTLVGQIMTFSRNAEHGRVSVNLAPLVEEVATFLRATIPSTVRIVTEVAPGCGNILADPTQLHQVLMNLGTNAAHAMEGDGGVLKIGLEPASLPPAFPERGSGSSPAPYVLITVSDTGRGIEAHDLERIFEPYFTTKTVGKGSGLGLSVVHGIVKSHRGIINVESRPGRGTVFSLCFPRVDAEPLLPEAEKTTAPGGREKVLVVDDDPRVADVTRRHLEILGYQVTTQTNSMEALALFRADPQAFDLVITDQTMPDLVGTQLVAEILAIRPAMPTILCTGYDMNISENPERDFDLGAFLIKPVARLELAVAVRQVLDARQT